MPKCIYNRNGENRLCNETIWCTRKSFQHVVCYTKTHCPQVLFARDVPICEIPSLFDNAAQIVTLHNSILVSFWQLNGTQIVLGDRLRRTKEPAKWRQSELFPKSRTKPDMSRKNHGHSQHLQSTLVKYRHLVKRIIIALLI